MKSASIHLSEPFLWLAVILITVAGTFAQPSKDIKGLIASAKLEGMRWPDFRDYQSSVQEFYSLNQNTPAWIKGGAPSPQALAMIELFRTAWMKGLEPDDYEASRWTGRVQALRVSPSDSAVFDVALTVCAMRYISALRIGRLNPQHFNFGLSIEQKKYDLAQFLREKLLTASDLSAVVNSVEPSFPGYRRTQQALVRYMDLAKADDGTKLPVPAKPLDPGQLYAGTARLAQLLERVGDLPTGFQPGDPQIYDSSVAAGVKQFQQRHGLDDDGRLGPATVKQLNVPLTERVRQLQLALEHWRWLPEDFSAPPIIVNLPDFHLRAFDENNNVALDMRVVVGRAVGASTPVFSRDMTFVVLRPYWNVPPGIFRKDVLPAIRRDRRHVIAKNFELTTAGGKIVTSGEVSDEQLAQLQAGKLQVRQRPGSSNALGLVKLMFPNEHHVYLHDTPSKDLFSRSRRDFSAGCIRVQKPAELAAWVLRNNPDWTLERVQQGMQSGADNVTVNLAKRVPVFIVYGTALAYENGQVHFYHDIYGHDAKLAKALAEGYPYP